jgi:uncharacterized membrane protein
MKSPSYEERRQKQLFTLIMIGFATILTGMIILIIASFLSSGNSSFGAFILIGPIPIIIGAGPEAQWLVLFAIIITVISVITLWAMRKRTSRNGD